MMQRRFNCLIFFLLLGVSLLGILLAPSTLAHRQHFSWSNIVWDANKNSLEITHRFHEHDAAQVLSRQQDMSVDITDLKAQAQFALYVEKHFSLLSADVVFKPTIIGAELKGSYILVYQELILKKLPAEMIIESDMLMEHFADQTNIINIQINQFHDTLTFSRHSQRLSINLSMI